MAELVIPEIAPDALCDSCGTAAGQRVTLVDDWRDKPDVLCDTCVQMHEWLPAVWLVHAVSGHPRVVAWFKRR